MKFKINMHPNGSGIGTSDIDGLDFRTDPNLSLEEKRRIAGDNNLEMEYNSEKSTEMILAAVEEAKTKTKGELKEWFKQLENRMKNRENK